MRYFGALAAPLFAFLVHRAMERYLGVEGAPFLTFYPAVILVAVPAGLWPGVVATILSALLADYAISPPLGSLFRYDRLGDAYAEGAFVLSGIFISVFAERYRKGQHKLARLQAENELLILEERAAESTQYKEMAMQSAGLGAWAIDREARTITLDQQSRTLLRLPVEGSLSLFSVLKHLDPADRDEIGELMESGLSGGNEGAGHKEGRVLAADGSTRWLSFDCRLERSGKGTVKQIGLISDITRQKDAEHRINRLMRIYAVLSDVNQTIVRERSTTAMLETICRIAVEKGRFRMAWAGLIDAKTRRLRIAASHGSVDGYLYQPEIDCEDLESAGRPAVRSLHAKEHVCCNDIEQEPEHLRWRGEALLHGYHSAGSFPLMIAGEPVGVFSMYSAEKGVFDREEVALLGEMAMDISFALEMQRRDEERQTTELELHKAHERLSLATAAGGVGIWDLDVVNNRLIWDEQMFRLYGVKQDAFCGAVEAWYAGLHPDDREWAVERFEAAVRGEAEFNTEFRVLWPDGSVHYIRGVAIVKRDGEGHAVRMVGTNWDITPLRHANRALGITERRYRVAFEMSPDAICISELETGRYVEVNTAFLTMMGFARNEVLGHTSLELGTWEDPRDRESLVDALNQEAVVRNHEFRLKQRDGSGFWATVSSSTLVIDGKRYVHSAIRDVSKAKKAEEEIRSLAFFDQLTGLANRRLLMEQLEQNIAESQRRGRNHALLYVDLDNFKALNDSNGHATGDRLLQQVAGRLTEAVRNSDLVGRLGGDEFVLVLSDLDAEFGTAAAQSESIAMKLCEAISRPYVIDGLEFHSSCCIGVTLFHGAPATANQVLQEGDIALYEAKAAGRNAVRFFSAELQSIVNARASLEDEMRRALQQGEFVLYYQPQMRDAHVIGAEALLRWRHPTRGLLPPGEFIDAAEESRLILPLGKWVIQEACRQLARWAKSESTAALEIAVNISASQFRRREFVDELLDALSQAGACTTNLRVELTESMLVEDFEDVIQKMKTLKEHGIQIALDDFGTGYSSLSYLNRLPLDQLKIDRSFVREMCSDRTSAMIAEAIISLGKTMGLSVIAEGVETPEQREFLAGLGCDTYQGYLFAPALQAEEFEQRLGTVAVA